jgi:hypothetical protein
MNRIILFSAIVLGTNLVGCASFDGNWKKHLPWSPEKRLKESAAEGPASLVAIWTPDILTQTGKPPTRGFGGRLYFYNKKSQAIPVEGQLIVYAYDDSEGKHSDGNPERKYAFTPDQFQNHLGESDLGPSYSVWIPWDAVGGEQKNISLVPVFTAANGQLVMGQQAMNVLPGKAIAANEIPANTPPMARIPSPNGIQPVSHYDPLQVGPESADPAAYLPSSASLKTSTIQVPKSLQTRLMQNQPPAPAKGQQPIPAWPTVEGNWGTVQTTTETIRLPAPAQQQATMGQPISTGQQPSAAGQPLSAAPQEAPPASKSTRPLSTRYAHSKHPARPWRDATTSPSGVPTPPFHAGPLSVPRPGPLQIPTQQIPGALSRAVGT